MNWIISSTLMFVSSVITYLFVRLAVDKKIANPLKNLAMFFIPVVLYLLINTVQGGSLTVNLYQFMVILFMAIFFSYLGNKFSLKSIELSPNPGFSLVISKSYVIFTTLAAVILFNSSLSFPAVVSILLIISGSALIMIEKSTKKSKKTNLTWFWLSLGAFFCWGMLALTSKYLLDIGVSIFSRLIYSMIIVSIIISWEIYNKKISLKIPRDHWITLLIIGLTGASFNYFMQLSYQLAPNVGYVNAMNASSIAAVTLLSGVFFKDELSVKKIAGVFVVVAGMILLVLTK
jgi:drug/metabolite transporter (DMT)-like permease